ncbi:hypothetical protein Fcan01_25322 [Folsomia candida]|uniref:Uncharacterized protein n=1 Tax=Folsomia candida TaxID=158441 RepID=A0A226D2V1_FOLCA|nr:hypothetical protein Fcan01_25322 [Folsomia candida]
MFTTYYFLLSTSLLVLPHSAAPDPKYVSTYECDPWRKIWRSSPNYELFPVARLIVKYRELEEIPDYFWTLEFSVALVEINDTYGAIFLNNIFSKPGPNCAGCDIIHRAKYWFPSLDKISPREMWPCGVMNVSAVHLLVNEEGQEATVSILDFTRLLPTATIASLIPPPNTVCKMFQAWDVLYNPTSLVLWEVEAVVVNCDILIGSGTPTNFSDGPPHFCAELEVLDHVQPQTVFDVDIKRKCQVYDPPLEPDWITMPTYRWAIGD